MSSLTVAQAITQSSNGSLTVIDVRETAEVQASGLAAGALHIPLALLPLRADPKAPGFDARLAKGKRVAIYCAKGGRAGMAAQTLARMGYEAHNIGGFGDWVGAGGPVA